MYVIGSVLLFEHCWPNILLPWSNPSMRCYFSVSSSLLWHLWLHFGSFSNVQYFILYYNIGITWSLKLRFHCVYCIGSYSSNFHVRFVISQNRTSHDWPSNPGNIKNYYFVIYQYIIIITSLLIIVINIQDVTVWDWLSDDTCTQ
jgi:hypothetical protein